MVVCCLQVKARLRNRELYQDFLKCLNLYAQEIISRQELLNLAHVSWQHCSHISWSDDTAGSSGSSVIDGLLFHGISWQLGVTHMVSEGHSDLLDVV